MAAPNKRRAASPREASPRPTKHHSNGTTKGVQTPGGPTAQERYTLYRTLKMLQIQMQGIERFLFQFSPFMDDECGMQARKLHGEITSLMPKANAVVEAFEGSTYGQSASRPAEGGAA